MLRAYGDACPLYDGASVVHLPVAKQSGTMVLLSNPLRRLVVFHTSPEGFAERISSPLLPLLSESPDVVQTFVVDLRQSFQGASSLQERSDDGTVSRT